MADVCTLTGTFCDPAGAPFGGARLVIRPVSTQPTVREDGSIVAAVAVASFETAEDGAVTIGLAPGLYRGSATQGAGGRSFNFDLAAPDLVTAPLADYIGAIDIEVQTSAQLARDQAVQAAEDTAALFTAAGGVAQAVANASAAAEATADDLAIVHGLRDEVELIAGTGAVAFYNSIALGRAAVADGASFGVRAGLSDGLTRPTIYRRDSISTQTMIVALVSGADIAAGDVAVGDLAAGLGGAAFQVEDGRAVFLFDRLGPLDSLDMLHGRRRIENLEIPGGEAVVEDGRMPVARDARGQPVIEANLHRQQLEAVWPLVSPMPPVEDGIMGTMMDGEGQTIAGYSPGAYYRLWPARHAGLVVRGDHNRLPQLWWCEDGGHGVRRVLRQITFAQHGVTGYRWVRFPGPTEAGEVILDHCDSDILRDRRHVTRRAKIPLKARATVKTKVVGIIVLGQSGSVSGGSTNSPNGVTGPQTIRTHLPVDGGIGTAPAWSHELMTFVGGTLPHQVGVTYDARNTAIDAAQIASLVPMREGLGGQDDTQGGSRESICSAMALHLAGPQGYDGSAYVMSAGFGFGSCSWQECIHDGSTRQQGYLNALAAIQKMKDFAAAKGLPIEIHVVIDQGEANGSEGRAVYAERPIAFLPILQSDIIAITGQAIAPQLFLVQTGYTKGSGNAPCDSALGQLDAAIAEPDIHLLPPCYWADMDGDPVHYKAPEHQLRAALYGEVISDTLIRDQAAALYIASATWSGATITLQMTHPVERDTDTIVGLTAALGVSCVDGTGAAIAVSRTEIDTADPTIVRVVCSAAITPGTAVTVRVAHNNAVTPLPKMGFDGGLRSGLRRSDWVRYSLIDGRPLPVFANIQSVQANEEV